MVSLGFVRTAARRRIGIERESVALSRMEMDSRGLRRMEELEAWSMTCGHVVIWLCHRGGGGGTCVFGGV
jgi:hypothetical protein